MRRHAAIFYVGLCVFSGLPKRTQHPGADGETGDCDGDHDCDSHSYRQRYTFCLRRGLDDHGATDAGGWWIARG